MGKDRGHVWKTDEDGSIDIFGFDPGDHHNGPICTICAYGYCHHCQTGPDEDCSPPEGQKHSFDAFMTRKMSDPEFAAAFERERMAIEETDRVVNAALAAQVERIRDNLRPYFRCEVPASCGQNSWQCGNCQVVDSIFYEENQGGERGTA